jgi:peptidoglycan hydrolase CwlO-like protein
MTLRRFQRLIFLIILIFVISVFGFSVSAQESTTEEECKTREECEALLKKYEEEIATYETSIAKTQKEKDTLANKIKILQDQIKKLDLQIYQSNLMIKDLSLQITDTTSSIDKNTLKIEELKGDLANILRLLNEEDQKSLVEVLFSSHSVSDFFDNVMALETLNSRNQELLKDIKNLKTYLEDQKNSLDQEKSDLEKLTAMEDLQRQQSQTTKKQQEALLEVTKGKESEYQKLLKEKQKKAADIRARIFELIGVPQAPTFGEAYDLAKYVEGVTGIRPAFLLAVLTQESNLGKNVGQCYLVNQTTGAGVQILSGKTQAKTMNPSRDVPIFLEITAELGRDPFHTPVSCPMSFGWGGAMGPAQFIPSTWANYKDRVRTITSSADPWNIKDSFIASALYLTDYGAKSQDANGEWRAAMIYFSGSTNTRYRFYGDSVMATAAQYENDIQTIENTASNSPSLGVLLEPLP